MVPWWQLQELQLDSHMGLCEEQPLAVISLSWPFRRRTMIRLLPCIYQWMVHRKSRVLQLGEYLTDQDRNEQKYPRRDVVLPNAMHVGIRSLLIYVLYNMCIAEIVS